MRALKTAGLATLTMLALTVQIAGACSLRAALAGQVSPNEVKHGAASVALQSESTGSQQGSFQWRKQLQSGRTVEIKGVNGFIHAEAASGSEVEVVAVKRAGKRGNPEDVRVEAVEHAEGVTICAVYPNVGGRTNNCEPVEGGRMNVRDNDVRVDFTVRVPSGIRFNGRTVNGEVEVRGLAGDVDVKTVNGDIEIATQGTARAKTVNGSINAFVGNANWNDKLEFATVNGGIDLSLPSNLSARVNAQTLNGEISSDFDMTMQGRISRREFSGLIGSGGRELDIKTVNGNIQLRRAS